MRRMREKEEGEEDIIRKKERGGLGRNKENERERGGRRRHKEKEG